MEKVDQSYEVIKKIKSIKEAIHHKMHHQFKALNLTAPQGMMVGILMRLGELKMTELTKEMDLSMSTVSVIVDRLERQNVVVRRKSDADKRVIFVSLAPAFKGESEERFRQIEKDWANNLSRATEEEIEKILEGITILETLLIHTKE